MNQQRNFQLPNPNEIFRDPHYNEKAKMSEREMQALMSSRPSFDSSGSMPPQQVANFEDINNAKLFQAQSLRNDLNLLKTTFQSKVTEIEKRLQIMEQPSQASQNPTNMQPFTPNHLTYFQPLQTQIQPMQQPMQQQPMQQQPMQQQPMQQGFQQPMQQGFQQPQMTQPMQQGFQQPQMTQPMQNGFQPFRATAPPNFR